MIDKDNEIEGWTNGENEDYFYNSLPVSNYF